MADYTHTTNPDRKLPKRHIAVVNISDPVDLAESLATACRGRAIALVLLRKAVAYLENQP